MAIPATSVSVGVLAGVMVADYPGQLPRTAPVSAVVVTICAVLGALVGSRIRAGRPDSRQARTRALIACGLAVVVVTAVATWWQHELRRALDVPDASWLWPIATGLPTVVVVAGAALPPGRRAWCLMAAGAVVVGYWSPTSPNARPVADDSASFSARQMSQRARDVVDRWVADGGLTRPTVIVAVPTGSGWVDAAAIAGFRSRFGPDVGIVGLRYANVSSWRAFLTDRAAAGRAAVMLLTELADALRTMPPKRQPDIVLYGQSLGAIGADAARSWARTHRVEIAETIEVGVPGGSVPRSAANRTTLVNATDPVPRWSPSLLWRPSRLPDDVEIIGRTGRAVPWIPVVTFVQTSVDLLGALDVPLGVGHRYGPEQAGPVGAGHHTRAAAVRLRLGSAHETPDADRRRIAADAHRIHAPIGAGHTVDADGTDRGVRGRRTNTDRRDHRPSRR